MVVRHAPEFKSVVSFEERRQSSTLPRPTLALKPQDVCVVLKLVSAGLRRAPYAQLALDLGMSSSEVHTCVKRSQASRFAQYRPDVAAGSSFTA